MGIIDIRHREYINNFSKYVVYRLCYEGGSEFITTYLNKFTAKETDIDYYNRLNMSYNPSYAVPLIKGFLANLVLNLCEVVRQGDARYLNCCKGALGGVDNKNSSMSAFVTSNILYEACFIGKVGLFVDNFKKTSNTKNTNGGKHPYVYTYRAEDILSWDYNFEDKTYDAVLLRDTEVVKDANTGLPTQETVTMYRYLKRTVEGIEVKFYDTSGKVVDEDILDLEIMPFHVMDLGSSLLNDLDRYQIALMNVSSSDLMYILKSNFPFYTEQYDPKSDQTNIKKLDADGNVISNKKIEVGPSKGRRYAVNTERPGFIHPSSEPITASMEKQKAMRQEMSDIITFNLSNLSDKEQFNVESGLSVIGHALENAENFICDLWHLYLRSDVNHTVIYPKAYDLRDSNDIQSECSALIDLSTKVPSTAFKREIYKSITSALMGNKVNSVDIEKIYSELDNASVFEANAETIKNDHEAGFVSTELASQLRGYPKGQVEQAKIDHAERLARISIAQTDPVRGVPDTVDAPGIVARQEKESSKQVDDQESTESRQRGKGK